MFNEKIKSFTVSGSSTAPQLAYTEDRIMVKLEGGCLKQDKVTYSHGQTIKIYIVYQLCGSVTNSSATLENCLFGAVTLTKNYDIDKYKYSGYVIGFYIQVEDFPKMLLFLELIPAVLYMLITKQEAF